MKPQVPKKESQEGKYERKREGVSKDTREQQLTEAR